MQGLIPVIEPYFPPLTCFDIFRVVGKPQSSPVAAEDREEGGD